ncbi:bridging integrator 3 [Cyrtonyx montezumae]|uniref:bridging integrator 3 n=1 Tax=Cyrtonyx montezumae TaxID=9017 RepID=UPI0032DB3393
MALRGRCPVPPVTPIPFKIGQPKKQIVPKTVERDFEREHAKLQQLEEQTKKLLKDLKKSTDADLAVSRSALQMSLSLSLLSAALCECDSATQRQLRAVQCAVRRMDSFNQEKVNQIQKTVIEPLKRFSSAFPGLSAALKRREQTLQECARLQCRVEKYEEKERSGPVLAKLHQAREDLRPVKEDFEAKTQRLMEEMPKFYNSRIQYFTPSFEALLHTQVWYYAEAQRIFSELRAHFGAAERSDSERERQNQSAVSGMRALSIVGGD